MALTDYLPAVVPRKPASTLTRWRPRDQGSGFDRGAALLALAALCDSGIEHYRGSFHNKTMYLPLGVAALTLAASLRGSVTRSGNGADPAVDGLAIATGIAGTALHVYNVGKRPGRLSWQNLFYSAPLGAPAALILAGLLRRLAATGGGDGTLLARLVSLGLLGSSAEAALLHYRGAFHDPAMVIPVTIPPLVAGLLGRAARHPRKRHVAVRWGLRLLVGIGFLGSAFHAYGISRNMGGWRNWSQNILNGPPLPAPPAFTALAVAGLAALDLIEKGRA